MRTSITAMLLLAGAASAAVKTSKVEYEVDGTKHIGFLAFDDTAKGKQPGVLVFHEWWGLDDYAKKRAEQLAGLGYVAFCADMYGEGKLTEHPKDAGKMAQSVRMNSKVWLSRAQAGLKKLQSHEGVDRDKISAIGYCFGGSTALTLAYSGAPLKAVATFHAALPTPTAEQAKAIKAQLLICTGADDPFIPKAAIEKFRAALDEAKAKYKFEAFPGTVHSFTVPGATKREIEGMAYNEAADKKSWQMMKDLFKETMGR